MDAQWLATQFRINPDKKQADLARALELTPPAISKILTGARQIKAKEYIVMRQFFGLPADSTPALSVVPANTVHPAHRLEERSYPFSVISPFSGPEKIRIFRIAERQAETDFRTGESVLIDTTDTNPSPGGYFLVLDGGHSYMIRHCENIPRSHPPEMQISTDTRETRRVKLQQVRVLGRIIGKFRPLD